MSNPVDDDSTLSVAPPRSGTGDGEKVGEMPLLLQYGVSIALVATATLLAFVADNVVAAPHLTLIFVLPVVVAATTFGWGPSVAAVVASVLAFDFFFTRPYFTLRMTDPSEIWAAALLLVTAAIVSAVAGQSQRRALEARRAAGQAQALQDLAHAVIEERSQNEILQAAATALSRIFAAPAAIFSATDGRLRTEAVAGNAMLSETESKAAKAALEIQTHVLGETYPNDQSRFDFWPVATPTACRYVLGVDFKNAAYERPSDPERFTDIIGAYIVANLTSSERQVF
jgi:K+-sensing histidine kinase KdpD